MARERLNTLVLVILRQDRDLMMLEDKECGGRDKSFRGSEPSCSVKLEGARGASSVEQKVPDGNEPADDFRDRVRTE